MTQENNKPRIPDAMDLNRLKRMQTVAKMKEFANRNGMGFVGGYYDEKTGELFQMDNLPEGIDIPNLTDPLLPDDLNTEGLDE
mgnify:FL=1|jgi:hypothetical protein|tara:strand:- start:57 stop:305 length:249 start_codon:yes stop_codon:yes gene_type:complete